MSAFSANWPKTRIIAEQLVTGPRSIIFRSPPGELEWRDVATRITRRQFKPLLAEAVSVFLPPGTSGEGDANPTMLLRWARWDGERDRDASKSDLILTPAVLIACYRVPPEQIPYVGSVMRQIDQALASASFPVEGIDRVDQPSPELGGEPPGVQAPTLFMRLWRRTRLQTLERGWQSGDRSCAPLTQAIQDCWTRLTDKSVLCVPLEPALYVERYDKGAGPDDLRELFARQ